MQQSNGINYIKNKYKNFMDFFDYLFESKTRKILFVSCFCGVVLTIIITSFIK